MKRNAMLWAAAAVILVALLSGTFFFVNYKKSHEHLTSQEIVQRLGEQKEKAGIMTRADQAKLVSIHDGIAKSHEISDQDLDWEINLLQSKPIKDTEANRNLKAGSVMLYLTGLRKLSAPQQQKLYQALSPYLTASTTEESHSLKLMAIRIVGRANVASAKPTLAQLAEDSDEDVSRRAKSMLQYMNSSQKL